VPFHVRSTHPAFSEFLRWHLEPFRRHREDPGAILTELFVRQEDEQESPVPISYLRWRKVVYRNPSLVDVARYALWDVQYHATQNIRAFVALHAGAVANADSSLVLPGPMESGKSTLVASLLKTGWSYLSDEVAALDPVTGRVYPFPKYLYLDQTSVDVFPGLDGRLEDRDERSRGRLDRTVRPEDLGAGVSGPLPPRAVVFLSRDRQGSPRLIPIASAEAVKQMADNCFNLHRYGDRGVVLLSKVATRSEAFRLEGGTAQERAKLLTERFGSSELSR
jgi:hypothetical protein